MRKAILVIVGLSFMAMPALAFHDSGVAHCNGCHTMHNSVDGGLVDEDSPGGNPWLLKDATPSDTCLNCHALKYGAVLAEDHLAPSPLKGAGNFCYLLADNLNSSAHGSAIGGDAAGHNLNAPGHGLYTDGTLIAAPGGTFPAASMGCTSCHDPHGTDAYRLLYGAGRVVQGTTFTAAAPEAEGLSLFGGSESQTSHVAYQGGMSDWCGNCHGDFHDREGGRLEHVSGSPMGGNIATIYNRYNGTTDMLGAVVATSYLADVPFDDPANTTDSTTGPSASSQVMCLTCHRAHGSSAPDAGRWDFNITLLDTDGGASYAIPNPYPGPAQRSLCNKCHAKDEFDHIAVAP